MKQSQDTPFENGFRRGHLAAQLYASCLRTRMASRVLVAPNELGYILQRLLRRMDAARGHTIPEPPVSRRNTDYHAISGEYFGFCSRLMDLLAQGERSATRGTPSATVDSPASHFPHPQ